MFQNHIEMKKKKKKKKKENTILAHNFPRRKYLIHCDVQ